MKKVLVNLEAVYTYTDSLNNKENENINKNSLGTHIV